jgi:hypothetical protein
MSLRHSRARYAFPPTQVSQVILNIESYSTVLSLRSSGQALCLKATQGMAEAQFKILQRLQETQCAQLK